VRGEVVHDHYIALAQGRAEDVTDIGPENLRIGGPLDGYACGGTIQAHRADHGGGMPMTLGAAGVDALPRRRVRLVLAADSSRKISLDG
jgi:hypothetical protein